MLRSETHRLPLPFLQAMNPNDDPLQVACDWWHLSNQYQLPWTESAEWEGGENGPREWVLLKMEDIADLKELTEC